MADSERAPVLLDTSVLINFLAIDRVDLIAGHPDFRFFVTEHVRSEVTTHYGEQLVRLEKALSDGGLEETRVESIEELALFAQLSRNPRLGLGECAAIAAAISRTHTLAIDDEAARKTALEHAPGLNVLDTQAIMLSLIRAGGLMFTSARLERRAAPS
jgi:predicted nucleic acid-binding protein